MRLTLSLLSGASLVCLIVACSADPSLVPSGPGATSPTSLGTSSVVSVAARGGGGGGGQDHGITVDVSGGIEAANESALIDRDTPSSLKILGGAELVSVFADELSLSVLAGSPTPAALGGCVVSPPDAAPAIVQRLIDRLDDPLQTRDRFIVEIDKRSLGQESARHILNHNWTDGDGARYRTWIQQSDHARDRLVTVTEVADDVYEFTGGSIINWDTAVDVALVCPNGGTITLQITR